MRTSPRSLASSATTATPFTKSVGLSNGVLPLLAAHHCRAHLLEREVSNTSSRYVRLKRAMKADGLALGDSRATGGAVEAEIRRPEHRRISAVLTP